MSLPAIVIPSFAKYVFAITPVPCHDPEILPAVKVLKYCDCHEPEILAGVKFANV